jgi:hypothetical protein
MAVDQVYISGPAICGTVENQWNIATMVF